jgi:radical SAM superfamily enzyme YgiQ (UPF0313 family)
MRIAFVSANREKLPDPVTPIGLLYVIASLPRGHRTELWDLCFEDDPLAHVERRLDRFHPDLVAVGLRNIQCGDYSGYRHNLEYYRSLIRRIRERSRARIVLGGGGFSVMPRELMEYLRPDFGIAGEGEAAFARLVTALEAHSPPPGDAREGNGNGAARHAHAGVAAGESIERELGEIGNLHYFRSGELRSVPSREFAALDSLPRPDRGLIDARYYAESGIDAIQTKRGCPLRCDYCTYPLIEGRSIRQREPSLVVDEMLAAIAQRPEINHFFIVDSVFNLPPAHAKAVCREMIRRRVAMPWTCYANPIGFDRELAELMRAAGCAGVEIGSDSGVDAVLPRLKKGFLTDRIEAVHEHCTAAGLADCHTFILGTSGETLADVRQTLDFCVRLAPAAAIFMIWTEEYEALSPVLAEQRRAFREQIVALMERMAARRPQWIIPSLARNYDERIFKLLRRRGLTGPLWQHIPRLRTARPEATASA